MNQTQQKFYSDLDLHFNTHPLNNDIAVLYDENSIKQNMYNIMLANNGDAKFHPEKCIGIRDMLFEPINILTEAELKVKIEFILSMWMPRIKVEEISVENNREYDGYDIEITYTTLNIIELQTTKLFLDRIR